MLIDPHLTISITANPATLSKEQHWIFAVARNRRTLVLILLLLFVSSVEIRSQTPNSFPPPAAAASRETTAQSKLVLKEEAANAVFAEKSANKATPPDQTRRGSSGDSFLKSLVLLPLRIAKALVGSFGEGPKSENNHNRGGVGEVVGTEIFVNDDSVKKNPDVPLQDSASSGQRVALPPVSQPAQALNSAALTTQPGEVEYENRNQIDPRPLSVGVISGRIMSEVGDVGAAQETGPFMRVPLGLFTDKEHRLVATTVADEDGGFLFAPVPPGNYRLVVHATGLCVANVRLHVGKNRTKKGEQIIVHMRPTGIDSCSYAEYKAIALLPDRTTRGPLSKESPIVTNVVKPTYPPIAAATRISGIVLVDVQLDSTGIVREALPIGGPPLFHRAAQEAALRWRFDDAENGNEVRSVRLTFIFRPISYVRKEGESDFTPPYQIAASWEGGPAEAVIEHSQVSAPPRFPMEAPVLDAGDRTTQPGKGGMPMATDDDVIQALKSRDTDESHDAVEEVFRRGSSMIPKLLSLKGNKQNFQGYGLGHHLSADYIFVADRKKDQPKGSAVTIEVAALYLINAIYYDSLEFAQSPFLTSGTDKNERGPNTSARINAAWRSVEAWARNLQSKGLVSLRSQGEAPLKGSEVRFWGTTPVPR